jgi:hypothetical protein
MTKEFEAIYLTLLVVVEYRFVFDSALHFTAFGIEIRRNGGPHKEGWAAGLIVPEMGDLGRTDLIFHPSFMAGEYAD